MSKVKVKTFRGRAGDTTFDFKVNKYLDEEVAEGRINTNMTVNAEGEYVTLTIITATPNPPSGPIAFPIGGGRMPLQ